jgi:hypothetical protein
MFDIGCFDMRFESSRRFRYLLPAIKTGTTTLYLSSKFARGTVKQLPFITMIVAGTRGDSADVHNMPGLRGYLLFRRF